MIAMRAVKPFGDPGPELINPPYQEAAGESDQDDVDDEIYECVHGDLGSLRIVSAVYAARGGSGCCRLESFSLVNPLEYGVGR